MYILAVEEVQVGPVLLKRQGDVVRVVLLLGNVQHLLAMLVKGKHGGKDVKKGHQKDGLWMLLDVLLDQGRVER